MSTTNNPDCAIHIEGLAAGFGDNEVLHKIDMDIPSRGVTAIIGPSGCGKSTLIRCINRMHELVRSAWCKGKLTSMAKISLPPRDPVLLDDKWEWSFKNPILSLTCRFATTYWPD